MSTVVNVELAVMVMSPDVAVPSARTPVVLRYADAGAPEEQADHEADDEGGCSAALTRHRGFLPKGKPHITTAAGTQSTAAGASASFTSETSGGSGTESGRNQRNARLPRG